MKNFNTLFLSTLGLGLLVSQAAQAQQSVGNGATPARTGTMLDVNGPLATAETAVAATGTTAPAAAITTVTGQARLTMGTATAGPITVSYSSPANVGQRLMIYNSTALAATFNSQDIAAGQAVEFVYSDSGWRATAGGGNITATNGLTKTGNAIGLGGTLTGPTSINQNGNNFGLTGGNVGIGTTSPTQPLDVAGNARVRGLTTAGLVTTDANGNLGSASAASLDATTASNGLTKTGTDVQLGGTLTRPTAVSGITTANTLSFVGATDAEAVVTVGTATGNSGRVSLGNDNHGLLRNLTGSTGGQGNDVALYTSNGGSLSRLFLANNPNTTGSTNLPLGQFTLMPSGYVGLGTANPTNKLHIVSSGGPGFADDDFVFDSYNSGGPATFYRHARGTVAAPANLVAGDIIHAQGDVGFIGGSFQQTAFLNTFYTGNGTTNFSYMQFGTSGAERLRIAENGNVGIGTTGPIQRLDVASGGLRVGSNSTISGQGAYLQWNRTGADGETWLLNQSGLGGGSMRFGSSDAVTTGANTITEWARFDPAGNLGIGTIPSQKLDVNGNTNVSGSSYVVNRVGIGNANPFAKLEISGGSREDGTGSDVAMAFSSSPATGLSPLRHYIRTRHTAGLGSGLGGNSMDFYLNNSGNNPSASAGPGVGNIQVVTFDNNNGEPRVGIGTTAPTQTLDVVGNARIRGLSAGGVVTADANGNLGLASGAAIDATTASNGLSKNGIDVQLGGVLTRPTAVSGISAANPLNFVGASDAEAAVTVGTATGNSGRVSLGNANHGLMRNLTGSTGGLANDVALYTTDGGGGGRLFLSSSSTISGSTNLPLGQFTLVPSGYVGLGTANPTNKLHIVSSGGPGFADDDFVFDSYTSGGPGTYYRHARGTVAAPANLVAGDGIHIQGDVGFIGGSFQQTAFLNTYYTGNGTTNLSYMQFGTSGAERLRIAENGNVGIGTPAPNSRLSLTPTATEAKITLFDGGSTTAHYGFGISSNQLNYDVTSGASHVFYVNSKNGSGSEVLRTNAAGTYIQTAGGPQLAITTTRGAVGTAVPANADGNVYYEVVGLENHVFGGNVVPNGDNSLSLGLSSARWSAVYATNGVVQTSDSRLKTHIENSGYGLQAVLKLRPVTYNWKSQPTTNHMVGFLAQELEQVVPEAVVAPKAAGEYYGVKYEELIPVLTKAIQEQQAQIEALKTANTKLQAQASSATQTQAELQDVKASLLTLAEQVKQLQAGGATATTK